MYHKLKLSKNINYKIITGFGKNPFRYNNNLITATPD